MGRQCVEANNAQQWPDLINGQYVLDESLDKCGSNRTSYRRVDGQSFIWFGNSANVWIGSTEICNADNSVKQFYSPGADSPSDVPKDSFFEQNAARNGWLSTKGMEIIQCDCKADVVGLTYTGTIAVTRSGKACMFWNEFNFAGFSFPDATVAEAANCCRNPNNDPYGPWCVFKRNGPRATYEYCNIPLCDPLSTDLDREIPTIAPEIYFETFMKTQDVATRTTEITTTSRDLQPTTEMPSSSHEVSSLTPDSPTTNLELRTTTQRISSLTPEVHSRLAALTTTPENKNPTHDVPATLPVRPAATQNPTAEPKTTSSVVATTLVPGYYEPKTEGNPTSKIFPFATTDKSMYVTSAGQFSLDAETTTENKIPDDVCTSDEQENCFNKNKGLEFNVETTKANSKTKIITMPKNGPKRLPADVPLFAQVFKDPEISSKRAKYRLPAEAMAAPAMATFAIAGVVGLVMLMCVCDLPLCRRQLKRAKADVLGERIKRKKRKTEKKKQRLRECRSKNRSSIEAGDLECDL